MGHSTNNWFSVHLDKPFVVIPSSTSSTSPSSPSLSDSGPDKGGRVQGSVVLHLTKPTKVKTLSVVFSGLARTAFYFDTSRIEGSKGCVASGKYIQKKHTFLQIVIGCFYYGCCSLVQIGTGEGRLGQVGAVGGKAMGTLDLNPRTQTVCAHYYF